MGIESVLIACLPSAITGFCFWCIEIANVPTGIFVPGWVRT